MWYYLVIYKMLYKHLLDKLDQLPEKQPWCYLWLLNTITELFKSQKSYSLGICTGVTLPFSFTTLDRIVSDKELTQVVYFDPKQMP